MSTPQHPETAAIMALVNSFARKRCACLAEGAAVCTFGCGEVYAALESAARALESRAVDAEARANQVAHAVGVEYLADGHAPQRGPDAAILERIKALVDTEARYQDISARRDAPGVEDPLAGLDLKADDVAVRAYMAHMGSDCDHHPDECPDDCPRVAFKAGEAYARMFTALSSVRAAVAAIARERDDARTLLDPWRDAAKNYADLKAETNAMRAQFAASEAARAEISTCYDELQASSVREIQAAESNLANALGRVEGVEALLAECERERDEAKAESEARRVSLLQASEERRSEWIRAENAEARGKALEAALRELAGDEDSGEYETEYDGRMYTHCLGCQHDSHEMRHQDSCSYARARLALATPPPARTDATASTWLVERGQNESQSPVIWWTGKKVPPNDTLAYGDEWTEDANKAIRFSTHDDARIAAQAHFGQRIHAIREHVWIAAPERAKEDGGG